MTFCLRSQTHNIGRMNTRRGIRLRNALPAVHEDNAQVASLPAWPATFLSPACLMNMSVQSIVETVEKADLVVAEQAAEVRHHPVTWALGHLSEVADQPPMLTLGAVVLAGGLLTGQQRVAGTGGRLLASVALAIAIKTVVKRVVVRTRPHVLADGGRHETGLLGATDGPHSSFPSGHTADAVAAARAVVRVYPEAQVSAYAGAAASE